MRLTEDFKHKALQWADQFAYCCVLDSNGYADPYGKYDLLIAAGATKLLQTGTKNAFGKLQDFYTRNPAWMFGLLGYDLKNDLEQLQSTNEDLLEFPELVFFVPEYLIIAEGGTLRVELGDAEILHQINSIKPEDLRQVVSPGLAIGAGMTRETYLNKVGKLKQHISRGDVYEVTFCQAFYAEQAKLNPLATYKTLNAMSPCPFSGYLKLNDKYLLCASPERFLQKQGDRLISQPIKGTARRSEDPEEDERIKWQLRNDLKEQTENVMIVDLVRNDLTRSAIPASVQVTEQFGVYSFVQVHQMISTISCELNPELHFIEAIGKTFPMGSMTGAPKIRAMQLIEILEESKRGAYSGAMGYIDPQGNFDLNVVIRSMFYAKDKEYLSFQVGSAITDSSDPEKEYEECVLKASAILETIKGPR